MSLVERDATTIKTDTKETSNELHEPATIWRNDRGLANTKNSLIWADIDSNERRSQ